MKVYDIRETVSTNQSWQFPTQSQSGNKYIMVMVNINSSSILAEPIKNCSDAELIRAYNVLMLCLQQAGTRPKKHILDNKISAAMKQTITDKYKMKYELPPKTCSQSSHTKLQLPFPQHSRRGIRWLSIEIMGKTITTGRNHYQSPTSIQCNTHSLCICTLEWPLWLQQNATCTNGLQYSNSWENR